MCSHTCSHTSLVLDRTAMCLSPPIHLPQKHRCKCAFTRAGDLPAAKRQRQHIGVTEVLCVGPRRKPRIGLGHIRRRPQATSSRQARRFPPLESPEQRRGRSICRIWVLPRAGSASQISRQDRHASSAMRSPPQRGSLSDAPARISRGVVVGCNSNARLACLTLGAGRRGAARA